MRYERFEVWLRKDARLTFWSIVAVVSVMWIVTLLDFAFGLGWGWDSRGLWAAPLILLIAVAIRLWHVAVDKLIDRLGSGS
jgi:sterol desaturase/sphingolipid hydroxylase (fatty acid hydroxylase superfamily)